MVKHLHYIICGVLISVLTIRFGYRASTTVYTGSKHAIANIPLVSNRMRTVHVLPVIQRKYAADVRHGVIGTADQLHIDNAYDNIFHIWLPRRPLANETITLQYELK